MKPHAARPPLLWRFMRKMNHRMIQNYRRGFGPRRMVLLLTTYGRKSGLPRQTPLQYEYLDGFYLVASARGPQADWYRNLLAIRQVEIRLGDECFPALAEPVTDPAQVADFLELRLKRHPLMIGLIMRLDGLPLRFERADLERFAAQKTLVILRPHPVTAPTRLVPPNLIQY